MPSIIDIAAEELSGCTPEQRDELLIKRWGFTEEELAEVRKKRDFIERVTSAAEMIYFKTGEGGFLTVQKIAAVASRGWKNWSKRNCAVAISRYLHDEVAQQKRVRDLEIPAVQLVREQVGAYDGNLEEAHGKWRKFKPSSQDWLRSVRIPTELGREESQLLGIYWADIGTYFDNSGFLLAGNKNDMPFYRGFLSQRIRSVHNLPVEAIRTDAEAPHPNAAETLLSWSHPSILVGSKAVGTWVYHDLGYRTRSRKLPKGDYDSQGFLEGVLAGKGGLTRNNKQGYRFTITEEDKTFTRELYRLASDLGYEIQKPTEAEHQNSWRLSFYARSLEKIQILNPYHRTLINRLS